MRRKVVLTIGLFLFFHSFCISQYAYIKKTDTTISVLDVADEYKLHKLIYIGKSEPVQVVFNSDSSEMYILLDNSEFYFFKANPSTHEIEDSIKISYTSSFFHPSQMVILPNDSIAIVNNNSNNLERLNLNSNSIEKVLHRDKDKTIGAMALNKSATKLYYVSYRALKVFNISNLSIEKSIPFTVGCLSDLKLSTKHNLAFVSTQCNNPFLFIINTLTDSIETQIRVGNSFSSAGAIAISPDENLLYVTNRDLKMIYKLDIQTRQLLDSIPATVTPNSLSFTPDGKQLFFTSALSGKAVVISVETDSIIKKFSVGRSPTLIAIVNNKPVSIQEIGYHNQRIQVYPNPSKKNFHLKVPFHNYAIRVINAYGKTILFEEGINRSYHTFELNQAPGIYFVSIIHEGQRFEKKIVLIK